MSVRLCPTFAAVLVFFCLCASARAVYLGEKKADVIAELGAPKSVYQRGDREILSYPKGVRIELVNGRVESATGVKVEIRDDITATNVEETPAPEAPTPPAKPAETPPPSTTTTIAASTSIPPTPAAESPAQKSVTPDEPRAAPTSISPAPKTSVAPTQIAQPAPTHHEQKLPPAEKEHESFSDRMDALPIAGLAMLLGLHFAATVIGLKIAFKVWTMDALGAGVAAIAGIDVALHTLFDLLGSVTNGFTTMPAVENGVPGIVMIFTIHHFCFNKNWGDAVRTASLVKLAVALLKLFGAMSLVSAVF